MFDREQTINRIEVGTAGPKVMELPNLVDIQLSSFERFLQRDRFLEGEPPLDQGLQEVFETTFPIESPSGDLRLEFDHYLLEEDGIKMSEAECKNKRATYAITVKARINLIFLETGEIRQKDIYMGDIPLMTERGTFIINGAERVVVSQIHRSPGVIFSHEKGVYSSRIIPYRGSWLEFEIDQKRDLVYAKIDRKKRILGTLFLRALGYETREQIIDLFYRHEEVKISNKREQRDELHGRVLARAVYTKDDEGVQRKMYRAGEKIHPHDIDELMHSGIKKVMLIDDKHEDSLHAEIILNCFEREESKFVNDDSDRDEPSK
ncbi:MAG: DNA-directed RNA polymerase subunit beta, partial [Spirochaeta sp.]|nr:DNA-directed RNA polymerase subunit beta [Spirochaeta sp.]